MSTQNIKSSSLVPDTNSVDYWRTRAIRAESMLESSAESRAQFLENIGRDYEANRLRESLVKYPGGSPNFGLLEAASAIAKNQGFHDVANEVDAAITTLREPVPK